MTSPRQVVTSCQHIKKQVCSRVRNIIWERYQRNFRNLLWFMNYAAASKPGHEFTLSPSSKFYEGYSMNFMLLFVSESDEASKTIIAIVLASVFTIIVICVIVTLLVIFRIAKYSRVAKKKTRKGQWLGMFRNIMKKPAYQELYNCQTSVTNKNNNFCCGVN